MQLENELAEAAAANLAARAIKLEQRLEDEILTAAVATLKDPDPERRAARMAELGEMVKRDKRTVQAITGLLGASSSGATGVLTAGSRGSAQLASAGAGAAVNVGSAGVNAAVSTHTWRSAPYQIITERTRNNTQKIPTCSTPHLFRL